MSSTAAHFAKVQISLSNLSSQHPRPWTTSFPNKTELFCKWLLNYCFRWATRHHLCMEAWISLHTVCLHIFTCGTVIHLQRTLGKMSKSFPQCSKAGILTRASKWSNRNSWKNYSEANAQPNYEKGPGLSTGTNQIYGTRYAGMTLSTHSPNNIQEYPRVIPAVHYYKTYIAAFVQPL